MEEAYLLLGSAAGAPHPRVGAWQGWPAAPGDHEPDSAGAAGAGAGACAANAWGEPLAVGSTRGTSCVILVLDVQGLISFKLSQVWHPEAEVSPNTCDSEEKKKKKDEVFG